MSAALVGNTRCLGRHLSEETKAKISTARKGKNNHPGYHPTEETKAKIGAAQRGPLKNSWKGGAQVWVPKFNARRRALGFVPLNSWFEGCEAHHINNCDVIHIPKILHRSIYHNLHTGQGMVEMNKLAGQFLTEDWT